MNPDPLPVKARLQILLPLPLKDIFDYEHPTPLPLGTLVKVSFRSREEYGIVWEEKSPGRPGPKTLKPLLTVSHNVKLPDVSIQFLKWVSEYTMAPQGQILKMMLPLPEAFETRKEKCSEESLMIPSSPQKPQLSQAQQAAADAITKSLETHNFQTFLLEGVTGSGKTEIYFEAIEHVLQKGGQALILLPEISLSAQWLQRFKERFGFQPAVWHSHLGKKERKTTFRAIFEGKASVVVGARSALFLPFSNLKLLIVDEEHDGSYKQEEGVIYNGRDMAVVRARFSQATCILASATPSLETELNVKAKKYQHLHLVSRYGGAELPRVTLVDLRKTKPPQGQWISPSLRQALQDTVERGEQAMLFLNRRGYAPLMLCHHCGERMMCPQCSVSLVYHKNHQKLLCHHCGYATRLPKTCMACNQEEGYRSIGPGVERIYEEVQTLLPQSRCALLTSDHLTTPQKIRDYIQCIQNHEIDILIGTQIMAKGHHFPLLTLVGIVDGDSALSGSDLRASEKSFQLLYQVAGRSGREHRQGQVLIQTHQPEHPVMQALREHDKAKFTALEAEQRQMHGFPPFGRLVALILSGAREEEVQRTAHLLAKTFPLLEKVSLLGPTPAPLSYLRGKHRWRLLMKTAKDFPPQPLLREWLSRTPLPSSVRLHIDVDPYSFF